MHWKFVLLPASSVTAIGSTLFTASSLTFSKPAARVPTLTRSHPDYSECLSLDLPLECQLYKKVLSKYIENLKLIQCQCTSLYSLREAGQQVGLQVRKNRSIWTLSIGCRIHSSWECRIPIIYSISTHSVDPRNLIFLDDMVYSPVWGYAIVYCTGPMLFTTPE